MNARPNSPQSSTQRRYDLDWLRVGMILVVFIFHTGRFFDTMGWHVKNAHTYTGMQAWTTFLASWLMPTIFVISGASLYLGLKPGGALKFIQDKVMRLLVPLVVGVFTHVALGVYLERLTQRQFSGSFFQFFPHYFQGLYGEGGNFAWMGLHLWYLLVLFVFSLVFLPLFVLLKGPGQALLRRLGDFFALPGMVYLLALPVVLLAAGVDPRSPLGDHNWGGWSLLAYIPFLLYGFFIMSHSGMQAAIRGWRWVSLGLGLAATAGLLYTGAEFGSAPYGTRGYALFNGLFGFNAWLWVLAVLGAGLQRLNFTTPALAYANEAVLPFYVLHQTVLLGVGYYVTRWQIADPLKFVVIALVSFATIMVVYEFGVRRVNALRLLFGMKPRKPTAGQPIPVGAKHLPTES